MTEYYAVSVKFQGQVMWAIRPRQRQTRDGFYKDKLPTVVCDEGGRPERRCIFKGIEPGKVPTEVQQLHRFFMTESSYQDPKIVKVSMAGK